jgi:hypothetical protein
MRARTALFIVFLSAVFVFATVSHGFAAQTSPEQQPGYQQNPANPQNQPGNNSNFSNDLSNSANPQQGTTPNSTASPSVAPGPTPQSDITPGVGNAEPPVARRQVGWGWLLFGLVIGFAIGALTMGPRRRYTTGGDIPRDRVA